MPDKIPDERIIKIKPKVEDIPPGGQAFIAAHAPFLKEDRSLEVLRTTEIALEKPEQTKDRFFVIGRNADETWWLDIRSHPEHMFRRDRLAGMSDHFDGLFFQIDKIIS